MRVIEPQNLSVIEPNVDVFRFADLSLRGAWRPVLRANGFRFFGSEQNPIDDNRTSRTLRVCVATSVRDIGCDDCANRTIKIGTDQVYMQGSLHVLLDATKKELRGLVEVVGIVIDDVPASGELSRNGGHYSHVPLGDRDAWIVPARYELPDGRAIQEIVRHIPSDYRKLPASCAEELIERERKKLNFERNLENFALASGADVIMSDHLMIRLEHVFREGPYARRVVNIHPAITWEYDQNKLRGKAPTADAIQRAVETGYCQTGASFHFISPELDAGPVICDGERTVVYPGDSPQQLRYRNYQHSKIPVMIQGLRYLAQNFEGLIQSRPDNSSDSD